MMTSSKTSARVLLFDLETDRLLSKTRDDHRELRVTVGVFCSLRIEDGAWLPANASWIEYVSGDVSRSEVSEELTTPDGEVNVSDDPLGIAHLFEEADRVVAYNGRGFDLEVLRGYYADEVVDRWCRKLRDPFEAIRDATGSWVKLDELLGANSVPFKKSGDGVSAVEWWAKGEHRRVADYCRGDVEALLALASLDKLVFPIKTWRTVPASAEDKLDWKEGGFGVQQQSAKRAKSSVQVVAGWGELDWKPYLLGQKGAGNRNNQPTTIRTNSEKTDVHSPDTRSLQ
jgi:hypothetical protein